MTKWVWPIHYKTETRGSPNKDYKRVKETFSRKRHWAVLARGASEQQASRQCTFSASAFATAASDAAICSCIFRSESCWIFSICCWWYRWKLFILVLLDQIINQKIINHNRSPLAITVSITSDIAFVQTESGRTSGYKRGRLVSLSIVCYTCDKLLEKHSSVVHFARGHVVRSIHQSAVKSRSSACRVQELSAFACAGTIWCTFQPSTGVFIFCGIPLQGIDLLKLVFSDRRPHKWCDDKQQQL